MSNFYQKLTQGVLIAGCIFATTPLVWATSFTINSGETAGRQALLDGETGLIISGGFINSATQGIGTSNGMSIGITITNNGTITSVNDAIELFFAAEPEISRFNDDLVGLFFTLGSSSCCCIKYGCI